MANKQTQLDIDSRAAKAAGMSYGYYMATKRPVPTLPVDVIIPEGRKVECAHCGTAFYTSSRHNVKYCSGRCQEAAKALRRRAKLSA